MIQCDEQTHGRTDGQTCCSMYGLHAVRCAIKAQQERTLRRRHSEDKIAWLLRENWSDPVRPPTGHVTAGLRPAIIRISWLRARNAELWDDLSPRTGRRCTVYSGVGQQRTLCWQYLYREFPHLFNLITGHPPRADIGPPGSLFVRSRRAIGRPGCMIYCSTNMEWSVISEP